MAIFGVSFGNGNDGVNCYSPSYAVELQDSSQAYLLARLALINQFNDNFQDWADKNLNITGEPEYKISATLSFLLDAIEARDYIVVAGKGK